MFSDIYVSNIVTSRWLMETLIHFLSFKWIPEIYYIMLRRINMLLYWMHVCVPVDIHLFVCLSGLRILWVSVVFLQWIRHVTRSLWLFVQVHFKDIWSWIMPLCIHTLVFIYNPYLLSIFCSTTTRYLRWPCRKDSAPFVAICDPIFSRYRSRI